MKLTLVVLAVLVVVVASLPQQPQQQRRQQAQGQRRRQQGVQGGAQGQRQGAQGAQGQRRRRPQGNRRPAGNANDQVKDTEVVLDSNGRPLHLDPNLTLSKISNEDLVKFMKNSEAVEQLVVCFETIKKCKARAGVSLVRDVRSLGKGATCADCDAAEQKKTRALVGGAISLMQQNHPVKWRRVLPFIAFLF